MGIKEFGAFVEIMPNKEGLLHVSEIDWKRIENPESVLKVGDIIEVKLLEIDQRSGKLKLSRKALLPKPEGISSGEPRNDNRDNSSHQDRGERKEPGHTHSFKKPR